MNISGGFDSALLPSQLKVFQILNVELYPTKIFVLVPKTRYDFFSKLNVTVNPENHLQSKQAIWFHSYILRSFVFVIHKKSGHYDLMISLNS